MKLEEAPIVETRDEIPRYTYSAPNVCIGDARRDAYGKLVFGLSAGLRYRVEELVEVDKFGRTHIVFRATPIEEIP